MPATPLRVERLRTRGMRNLHARDEDVQVFEPGPAFNVIHGDNGAGKSNLLEAIYYLAALKSFRGAKTDDFVAIGADVARLEARVSGDASPRTFRVDIERGKARRATVDGKRPRSGAVWRGAIQAVIFHPGHLLLAAGAPELRRDYLDRILEQIDPTYVSAQADYQRALRSRNRLLRQERIDRRSVVAFDELLAAAGEIIGTTRARIVDEIAPFTEQAFLEVHGEGMPLRVQYRPRVEPTVAAIKKALAAAYEKDVARGFTADGPHADDLLLEVRDRTAAKHHASQGQQRAIVLAMKVAELDVLTRRVGRVPILLLDDVSSELDRTRNERLFRRLKILGGQVFLTTTHPEHIRLDEHRHDFVVNAGVVAPDPDRGVAAP